MQHDHNIGARIQRRMVAGLLVTAVAAVAFVNMHLQPYLLGKARGFVRAVVVDQDAGIHRGGNLLHGSLQRLLRVIGGQHGYNFFMVDHRFRSNLLES